MTATCKLHGLARISSVVMLTFGTLLIIIALSLHWVEQARNREPEYEVYSAYLSEGILNDAHDWSVGPSIQVVIDDRIKIGATLRWWWLYLLHLQAILPALWTPVHPD